MHRKLFLVLTLSAWLLATGCPWDLMQTFAWGRMFASYSQSMPLLQAAKKALSGDAICGICEIVQDGRRQTDTDGAQLPGPKSPGKILFVSPPPTLVFASPALMHVGLVPEMFAPLSADRAAPPCRPPRV